MANFKAVSIDGYAEPVKFPVDMPDEEINKVAAEMYDKAHQPTGAANVGGPPTPPPQTTGSIGSAPRQDFMEAQGDVLRGMLTHAGHTALPTIFGALGSAAGSPSIAGGVGLGLAGAGFGGVLQKGVEDFFAPKVEGPQAPRTAWQTFKPWGEAFLEGGKVGAENMATGALLGGAAGVVKDVLGDVTAPAVAGAWARAGAGLHPETGLFGNYTRTPSFAKVPGATQRAINNTSDDLLLALGRDIEDTGARIVPPRTRTTDSDAGGAAGLTSLRRNLGKEGEKIDVLDPLIDERQAGAVRERGLTQADKAWEQRSKLAGMSEEELARNRAELARPEATAEGAGRAARQEQIDANLRRVAASEKQADTSFSSAVPEEAPFTPGRVDPASENSSLFPQRGTPNMRQDLTSEAGAGAPYMEQNYGAPKLPSQNKTGVTRTVDPAAEATSPSRRDLFRPAHRNEGPPGTPLRTGERANYPDAQPTQGPQSRSDQPFSIDSGLGDSAAVQREAAQLAEERAVAAATPRENPQALTNEAWGASNDVAANPILSQNPAINRQRVVTAAEQATQGGIGDVEQATRAAAEAARVKAPRVGVNSGGDLDAQLSTAVKNEDALSTLAGTELPPRHERHLAGHSLKGEAVRMADAVMTQPHIWDRWTPNTTFFGLRGPLSPAQIDEMASTELVNSILQRRGLPPVNPAAAAMGIEGRVANPKWLLNTRDSAATSGLWDAEAGVQHPVPKKKEQSK